MEKDFVSELVRMSKTEGEAGVEYDFSGVELPKLSRRWKLFFKTKSLGKGGKNQVLQVGLTKEIDSEAEVY